MENTFPKNNKSVVYYAVNKPERVYMLGKRGCYNQLISYAYLKKNKKYITECLPYLKDNGGLLMLDSGIHTFRAKATGDVSNKAMWLDYIKEYTEFIEKYSDYLYSAVNFDLDIFLSRQDIDSINKEYFKPLEAKTNIIYVVHGSSADNSDPAGYKRFEEYAKQHEYLGFSFFNRNANPGKFNNLAKRYGVRVHGFGFTRLSVLKSHPFFSVDSTSWTMGERYGATFKYDGKNFRSLDKTAKFRRKQSKVFCKDNDVDYKGLLEDKKDPVHDFNILAWKGFEKEYYKLANLKLHNKPVYDYDKRRGSIS
jgi:hypothetical protein